MEQVKVEGMGGFSPMKLLGKALSSMQVIYLWRQRQGEELLG